MKLTWDEVRVASRMHERGASVRRLAKDLRVTEHAVRYRLKRLGESGRPDVRRHPRLGRLATDKTGPPPWVERAHVVASLGLLAGKLGTLVKPLKRPLRRLRRRGTSPAHERGAGGRHLLALTGPAAVSFPHSGVRRGSASRIRGIGEDQLPAFAGSAKVSFPHSRDR